MNTISKKKTDHTAWFLLLSGLGAGFLTAVWHSYTKFPFDRDLVLCYYIFNSTLLILSGITLNFRSFKIHSILSIVLGISVTVSIFIFNKSYESLFLVTVFDGVIVGAFYGGTILVPMFLISVYMSAIRGIHYMRGTLAYDTQDTNTETLPTISKLGSEKNLIHEVIPIVLIFVNGFLYIITYTFQRNPYIFVISVVLPFISLFSKKPSTYRICNMVGVILVLYLFFFQYIVYFLSLLNA